MNNIDRFDDGNLDGLITHALQREAERLTRQQPDAGVAIARLTERVTGGAALRLPRTVAVLAWLVLLLLAVVVAALVGGPQLDDAPIQAGPLGLGAPCDIQVEAGTLASITEERGFGRLSISYFESGVVTESRVGNLGLTAHGRPRALAVVNTLEYEGRLSGAGLSIVRERLARLELEPGCYSVRLDVGYPTGGALVVRTEGGPARLSWAGGRGSTIDPLLEGQHAQLVGEVLEELLEPDANRYRDLPDRVATWLPEDAWEAPFRPGAERWLAHVTFSPTDYPPTAVLQFGAAPPASATDGRFAAVELPGGATLDTIGSELQLPRGGRPQRCAVLDRSDALRLATSLEAVDLGVEAEADLFTPDMAWGVDVELISARSFENCSTLEAHLREDLAPTAPPSDPPIVGDLASIDPCTLVPPEVRGQVDEYGYRMATPQLGVTARSCLIERRSDFGVLEAWTVLWLYPRTVSEADAARLATAIFGDGITPVEIAGEPGWLNHCITGFNACTGGAATLQGGRFLLLEVWAGPLPPDEKTRRAIAILERVASLRVST